MHVQIDPEDGLSGPIEGFSVRDECFWSFGMDFFRKSGLAGVFLSGRGGFGGVFLRGGSLSGLFLHSSFLSACGLITCVTLSESCDVC